MPWITAAVYLSLAVLFMTFYTLQTVWMPPWGIEGLTHDPPFPFRYRILSTFLASGLSQLTGVSLEWVYAALGTLWVWGTLLVYRRVLACFMRVQLAGLLAPGLLYGMTWHYCAMNRLYFPFDMPAVFFFVAGWFLLLRRYWYAYYVVFALAVLNRETCLMLTVVFAFVWYRRMPTRELAIHVAAQTILWVGIKFSLYLAYTPVGNELFINSLATNRHTLVEILTLQGEGLKNLTKFLLWCGGLWAVVPFIFREQPTEIRRSLLAIVPFLLGLVLVGTLREMRIYAEVIPIVITAALIWTARRLDHESADPLLRQQRPHD